MADYKDIAGRIRTTAADGVVVEAQEMKDLLLDKSQQEVNADVQQGLSDRYTKEETYNREEVESLIDPDGHANYAATDSTTSIAEVLPVVGEADTIYRIGNWDGTQYDPTVYALYSWNGTAYVCLAVRSFIGEIYDISANHPDGQGDPAVYADIAAALGTDGENIPADIRRGGMTVKFIQGDNVQSSGNKYVQYRYMGTETTGTPNPFLDTANWQGVDTEPTPGSKNLVESSGIKKVLNEIDGDLVVNVAAEEDVRIEKIIYPYALPSGSSLRIKITASSSSVIPTAGTISLRGSDDAVLKTNKYWSVGDDYTLTLDRDIDYINCIVAAANIGGSGTLTFEIITNGKIQNIEKNIEQIGGRVTTLEGNVAQLEGNAIQLIAKTTFLDKELLKVSGDRTHIVNAEQGVAIEKNIYPYNIQSGTKVRIKISASSAEVVPGTGTISLRRDNVGMLTNKYWSVGDDYTFVLDSNINYITCAVAGANVQGTGTLTFEIITEGSIQKLEDDITNLDAEVTKIDGQLVAINDEIVKTNSNIGYYKGYDSVVQNTAKQYNIGYILNAGERLSIRITGNSSLIAIEKPFVVKANSSSGTTLVVMGLNTWERVTLADDITSISILINAENSVNTGDIVIELSSMSAITAYQEMSENTNTDFKNFCKKIGTTPIATWVDDDGKVTDSQNIQNNILPIADEFGIPVTFALIDLDGSAVYDGNTYTKEEFFELMQKKGHHITSHPTHTHWYGDNYDITQVEPELIENLMLLKNKFLHSDMLIYPGSSSLNPLVVDIVKKWCVCGVTAGVNYANHLGDNTKWQIKRTFISFTSVYDVFHNQPGFINARHWLTKMIDEAYANGDWIVFGTHSWLFSNSDSTSDGNANTRGNLRYIINYAKEKGFEFKTLWDAYNTRRILFDVNDYNQNM